MPNQETIARIIEKLKTKMGENPRCPLCNHSEWTVGHFLPLSLANSPTQMTIGVGVYPLIALVCSYCGNTHLINLMMLGFAPEELDSMKLDGSG